MPNGLGQRRGSGQGMGFGFRGTSPPWPYVGRGRGGLPRCSYYLRNPAGAYGRKQAAAGYVPYTSASKEEELTSLKLQADAIKDELGKIESRINDLESGKE